MKTKYLLQLLALNLALTTVFAAAAALPSPSPSQNGGGGGGGRYASMLASMSSVKIIERMKEHEEHGAILNLLRGITDKEKKQGLIQEFRKESSQKEVVTLIRD